MRVLHIINNLDKGGAERLLTKFLPVLHRAGVNISLIQLNDNHSVPEYVDLLTKGRIRVLSANNKFSLYDPRYILLLKQCFSEGKYDIVHCHLFPSMYWAALAIRLMNRRSKPKLIFTEHSNQNRRFNNTVFRILDRVIYNTYDKVIAISPNIKDKLDEWNGKPNKNTIIRNGVDTEFIAKAPIITPRRLREMLGFADNTFVMMMTARFHYPKNQQLIIRALTQCDVCITVIFAGMGEGLLDAEKLVEALNLQSRVRFLGFRNDVPSLMKSVDLNVLATDYEGMSGVTLEALTSGRPFIGSNVPGVNDVVPNKEFCFENNLPSLSNKITEIYNDKKLASKLAKKGKIFAQRFDMSQMVTEHLSLYNNIVKQG